MLMLRLQRIGRRNEAHFKIVVIEKTQGPKSQKYVDIVGSYNPKLGRIQMDEAKVKEWLSHGVQPSDTVYNMLVSKGIIEGKKKNVLPHKSPVVDEEKLAREKEEAEAKAAKEAEENTELQDEMPNDSEVPNESAEKSESENTEDAPVETEEATEEASAEAEEPKGEEAPVEESKKEEAPSEEEKKAE